MKVCVFAWRIFQNTLPTKDNLFRRRKIPLDSQLCLSCCGSLESKNQFFFTCNVLSYLWHLVYNWLDIWSVNPFGIVDHFAQFCGLADFSKFRLSIMHLLWFTCAWVIWKERYDTLFNNKEHSNFHLFDKIKMHFFLLGVEGKICSYYFWLL